MFIIYTYTYGMSDKCLNHLLSGMHIQESNGCLCMYTYIYIYVYVHTCVYVIQTSNESDISMGIS